MGSPFLKDALDLGPEAEAVQEVLEGLPGEVVRFKSLRLVPEEKEEKLSWAERVAILTLKSSSTEQLCLCASRAAEGARGAQRAILLRQLDRNHTDSCAKRNLHIRGKGIRSFLRVVSMSGMAAGTSAVCKRRRRGRHGYPVVDEAALLQGRLHSLLVREQLEDAERERESIRVEGRGRGGIRRTEE